MSLCSFVYRSILELHSHLMALLDPRLHRIHHPHHRGPLNALHHHASDPPLSHSATSPTKPPPLSTDFHVVTPKSPLTVALSASPTSPTLHVPNASPVRTRNTQSLAAPLSIAALFRSPCLSHPSRPSRPRDTPDTSSRCSRVSPSLRRSVSPHHSCQIRSTALASPRLDHIRTHPTHASTTSALPPASPSTPPSRVTLSAAASTLLRPADARQAGIWLIRGMGLRRLFTQTTRALSLLLDVLMARGDTPEPTRTGRNQFTGQDGTERRLRC
ncbi:unnamed protein product [Arctogadus glacialis]